MIKASRSLSEAVSTSRAEALRSLAAKLAKTIEKTESGRDVAALSKQLRDTLSELDALGEGTANTPDVLVRALKNRRKS